MASRDWLHGVPVAIANAALVLGLVAVVGGALVAWEPNWAEDGVNVFSNLHEEVISRGLLLV